MLEFILGFLLGSSGGSSESELEKTARHHGFSKTIVSSLSSYQVGDTEGYLKWKMSSDEKLSTDKSVVDLDMTSDDKVKWRHHEERKTFTHPSALAREGIQVHRKVYCEKHVCSGDDRNRQALGTTYTSTHIQNYRWALRDAALITSSVSCAKSQGREKFRSVIWTLTCQQKNPLLQKRRQQRRSQRRSNYTSASIQARRHGTWSHTPARRIGILILFPVAFNVVSVLESAHFYIMRNRSNFINPF